MRPMTKAPPSIAATSTLAMVRTAEARGIRTTDLLERAGLTPESLADPDARIPGSTVLAIWNALRERAADPVLQLVAPVTLPFGAYRVIDHLVAASATVGEGVCRFARFFGLIADAVTLTIHKEKDEYSLCLAMADGGPVPPVYVDYIFAALVSRVRMRIRPALQVARLELRQADPPSPERYREVFRATVFFCAAADRLCFSEKEWKSPMDSADVSLARILEEHARILSQRVPQSVPGIRADVQKAVASVLPDGGAVADVARTLHLSVRTLQRKLVENGTSFREISDSVRARLAEEYLTDPKVSIAEVACLLGFSDQSSFHRAFGRWTGESPGRWRRRQM